MATVESEFVVDFSAKSAGGANFLTKSTDGNRPDYKIRTQKDSTIFVNFFNPAPAMQKRTGWFDCSQTQSLIVSAVH